MKNEIKSRCTAPAATGTETILVNRSSSICMNILPQTGVVVVKVQLVASQPSFPLLHLYYCTRNTSKTLTKRNAIARFPTRRSGFSAFVTTVCARFPLIPATSNRLSFPQVVKYMGEWH